MWAFFSKRLRTWLILAVVVPAAGLLLGKLGDLIEARRGPSGLSRNLKKAGGFLARRGKGPLAAPPKA